jgi:hypothetical protein
MIGKRYVHSTVRIRLVQFLDAASLPHSKKFSTPRREGPSGIDLVREGAKDRRSGNKAVTGARESGDLHGEDENQQSRHTDQ